MEQELEKYIQSNFGMVNQDEIKKIASLFTTTKVKKGEHFLKYGNRVNELSFIKSGILRLFVSIEGKEITQWISSKGSFVTDLSSFIFNNSSRWNIQALTDTNLYSISKSNYDKIGKLIPSWDKLEKLFIVNCFTMMEDRILALLSKSAEERYLLYFNSNKELFNQVPLQYIASILAMTPETLSRIRKKQTNSFS